MGRGAGCAVLMTLPGAGWSEDFYANQQALPNEHLPIAQSPEGGGS